MKLPLLKGKVLIIYLICGGNKKTNMKFYNNKETPYSIRLDWENSITVKNGELSPTLDFFLLSKNNLKYILTTFPILFDSESERNKIDRKNIPYALYKKPSPNQEVKIVENPVMPVPLKKEEDQRFTESKNMEVEEVKVLEPKNCENYPTIKSVEKSIFETREIETLKPVRAREDSEEDVMSGSLERILNIAEMPKEEPKKVECNPLGDMESIEASLFSTDSSSKELTKPKKK